ncbi:hypothetical protein ATANTOWER_001909 [Ataeniobius toweri]|uniref:Uncharacterized protein n=1 Tax=Ataeniobius toweri TaxID=208326 RepID=A0ABU7BM17_9TELE|nr:hypothetical protein [Ataeniobius toweri]
MFLQGLQDLRKELCLQNQIRTGAAGPIKQSKRRPARPPACLDEKHWQSDGGGFTSPLCLQVTLMLGDIKGPCH